MGERRGTKALELWCRRITEGYPGVNVQNMTTSWKDGLAFCAMIHHFRPDLIEFERLNKEDVYGNNELAFRTAEQHLGIPALLDAEDMASCQVPDRLSILTYLSQFYQTFGGSSPSRLAVNRTTETSSDRIAPVPVQVQVPVSDSPKQKVGSRLGLRRDPCASCGLPVFLAEKLVVSRLAYHRTCFRCARCRNQLTPGNYYETESGEFCCEACPDEVALNPPTTDLELARTEEEEEEEEAVEPGVPGPLSDEEKSRKRILDTTVPDLIAQTSQLRLNFIASHLLNERKDDHHHQGQGHVVDGQGYGEEDQGRGSGVEDQPRTGEGEASRLEDRERGLDGPGSRVNDREQGLDGQVSRIDGRESRMDGLGSRSDGQAAGSRLNDRGSRVGDQESRMDGPGSRENGPGSRTDGPVSTVDDRGSRSLDSRVDGLMSRIGDRGSRADGPGSMMDDKVKKSDGLRVHSAIPDDDDNNDDDGDEEVVEEEDEDEEGDVEVAKEEDRRSLILGSAVNSTRATEEPTAIEEDDTKEAPLSLVQRRLRMFEVNDIPAKDEPKVSKQLEKDPPRSARASEKESMDPSYQPELIKGSVDLKEESADLIRASVEPIDLIKASIEVQRESIQKEGTTDSKREPMESMKRTTQSTREPLDPMKRSGQPIDSVKKTREPISSAKRTTQSTKEPTDSTKKNMDSIMDPIGSIKRGTQSTKEPIGSRKKPMDSTTEPTDSRKKHTDATRESIGSLKRTTQPTAKPIGSRMKQMDSTTEPMESRGKHTSDAIGEPINSIERTAQSIGPVKKLSDSTAQPIASVKRATETAKEPIGSKQDYPEDLNPFKSDEDGDEPEPEEEVSSEPTDLYQTALDSSRSSKHSTNPFDESGSDGEPEEVAPRPATRTTARQHHVMAADLTRVMAADDEAPMKRRLAAPQINLNPFWSDEEEEEEEVVAAAAPPMEDSDLENKGRAPANVPVPKPRTIKHTPELGLGHRKSELNRSGMYASNSSISSESASTPGGTYRKKKPAPPPPMANELFPKLSTASPQPQGVSPRTTPRARKTKPAPPPPMQQPITSSTPYSPAKQRSTFNFEESPISELGSNPYPWEDQKTSKDQTNRNRQSLNSYVDSYPVAYPDKSVQGKWKRKKGPAPPRPIPHRRKIKVMSMKDVKLELDEIEMQQQGLERQGVRLEQLIRDKCESGARNEDSCLAVDVEELVLELFALVNEKNELFRRQAELMLLRRQQRLEEEHAEVEYQIRCLMSHPEATKTDFDKQREEALIQRLVEIVERRNEIVECLEMDRRREVEEDRSIHKHMGLFAARNKTETSLTDNDAVRGRSRSTKTTTKEKSKEKKSKEKKSRRSGKKDADKDVDEAEVKQKRGKRRWF